MTVKFYTLGAEPPEIAAACHLAQVAHVRVGGVTDPALSAQLRKHAFFQTPRSIESLVDLPFDSYKRPRWFRKNLSRSLLLWKNADLELHIDTVASYGIDRVIEGLYFPIFVPVFYARGISPHGAHNVDTFRNKIAKPDTIVAFVRRHGTIVGGAVLGPREIDPRTIALKGAAAPGSDGAEGLIYVLNDAHAHCQRALLLHLCEAFTQLGHTALSLGSDLSCVDGPYARALFEKFVWADHVVAHIGPGEYHLSLCAERVATERSLFAFALDGNAIEIRGYGEQGQQLAAHAEHLLPLCYLRAYACANTTRENHDHEEAHFHDQVHEHTRVFDRDEPPATAVG
jgi:hypothetical protein